MHGSSSSVAARSFLVLLGAFAVAGAWGCRAGKGPRLQLVTPAGPGPTFGDAPNRSAESMRASMGGGGGPSGGESGGTSAGGAGAGLDAARVAGAAAGIGAGAVMLSTGMVTCKPGMDTLDAGARVNVCSGEPRAPMLGPSPAP